MDGAISQITMKQQMKASAYRLKPADIKKLTIASPNFRDRCIVKTLYWAGLRRHELVALDIRDLDFERKRITVQNGKGGKTRIVPLIDDEYVSDLAHLIGSRKQGAVFLSNQDKALSSSRAWQSALAWRTLTHGSITSTHTSSGTP